MSADMLMFMGTFMSTDKLMSMGTLISTDKLVSADTLMSVGTLMSTDTLMCVDKLPTYSHPAVVKLLNRWQVGMGCTVGVLRLCGGMLILSGC